MNGGKGGEGSGYMCNLNAISRLAYDVTRVSIITFTEALAYERLFVETILTARSFAQLGQKIARLFIYGGW